jgi:hypothetical protein
LAPPLGFCEHGTETSGIKIRGKFPVYFSRLNFSAIEVGKDGENSRTTKYQTTDMPSLASEPLRPLELV